MRRQYVWTLLVILVVAIIRLRSGGAIPLPASYQTLPNGDIRIHVHNQSVPRGSHGEVWNLVKQTHNIYTVNLFLNGNESRTFVARSLLHASPTGKNYTSAGKIRFVKQNYHATDIFVKNGGKTGYIDFAKN